MLSPEELKQKRQEIVSRQEAEQQELEALRRREMQSRKFPREEPSRATGECSKGVADLLPVPAPEGNDVDERRMISVGDQVGTIVTPAPSPWTYHV